MYRMVSRHRGGAAGSDVTGAVLNGAQFEGNYFLVTPAYRDTIAHGGVLKNGVYTRIYHHDGQILRVDIRKP
jgi:hypothetical protein